MKSSATNNQRRTVATDGVSLIETFGPLLARSFVFVWRLRVARTNICWAVVLTINLAMPLHCLIANEPAGVHELGGLLVEEANSQTNSGELAYPFLFKSEDRRWYLHCDLGQADLVIKSVEAAYDGTNLTMLLYRRDPRAPLLGSIDSQEIPLATGSQIPRIVWMCLMFENVLARQASGTLPFIYALQVNPLDVEPVSYRWIDPSSEARLQTLNFFGKGIYESSAGTFQGGGVSAKLELRKRSSFTNEVPQHCATLTVYKQKVSSNGRVGIIPSGLYRCIITNRLFQPVRDIVSSREIFSLSSQLTGSGQAEISDLRFRSELDGTVVHYVTNRWLPVDMAKLTTEFQLNAADPMLRPRRSPLVWLICLVLVTTGLFLSLRNRKHHPIVQANQNDGH